LEEQEDWTSHIAVTNIVQSKIVPDVRIMAMTKVRNRGALEGRVKDRVSGRTLVKVVVVEEDRIHIHQ
jgi:hypothetical protein